VYEQTYLGLCKVLLDGTYSVRVFGPGNHLAGSLVSGRVNQLLVQGVEVAFSAEQRILPISSTTSQGTSLSVPIGATVSYKVLHGGVIELRLPDGGRALFTPKTGTDL